MIGVRSTKYATERGVVFTENVRYCRDRRACVEGSRFIRFVHHGEKIEA